MMIRDGGLLFWATL